jgi:hypothetical protein
VNEIEATLNSASTIANQTMRGAIDLAKAKAQFASNTVWRAIMLGERLEARHAREREREEERTTRILGQKHTEDMLKSLQMTASVHQVIMPRLRWAVDVLDKAGILQSLPALLGLSVSRLREYLVGIRDPRVVVALNHLQRFAVALDMGLDRAMGLPASVARIARIAVQQVGDLERAPRQYWDTLLTILEKQMRAQQSGLLTTLRKMKVDDDVIRAWLEPDESILDRFLKGPQP